MTRLIAISGFAGSGKSTAARHLVDAHGFTLVKFAGPLKQMMQCLGLGNREIEGDLKEQPCQILGGQTPRHAMQTIGTEWGRELIHPDLWVNVAMASVSAVLDQGGRVVIDDLRFPNEISAIKGAGGLALRINRPGVGHVNGHVSEGFALPVDIEVENGGSVADLAAALETVVTGA